MICGFALNKESGSTEYVLVSAKDEQHAQDFIDGYCIAAADVFSVTPYDAETIIEEQYNGMAFLTTEAV